MRKICKIKLLVVFGALLALTLAACGTGTKESPDGKKAPMPGAPVIPTVPKPATPPSPPAPKPAAPLNPPAPKKPMPGAPLVPPEPEPMKMEKIIEMAKGLSKFSGPEYDKTVQNLKLSVDHLDQAALLSLAQERSGQDSILNLLSINPINTDSLAIIKKVIDVSKTDANKLINNKGENNNSLLENILLPTRSQDDAESLKQLIILLEDNGADLSALNGPIADAINKVMAIQPDGMGQKEAWKAVSDISKIASTKAFLTALANNVDSNGDHAIHKILKSKATEFSTRLVKLLIDNGATGLFATPAGNGDTIFKILYSKRDALKDSAPSLKALKDAIKISTFKVDANNNLKYKDLVKQFLDIVFKLPAPGSQIKPLMDAKSKLNKEEKAALMSSVVTYAIEKDASLVLKGAQNNVDLKNIDAKTLGIVLAKKGADFGFGFDSSDVDFIFEDSKNALKSGTLAELAARALEKPQWVENDGTAMAVAQKFAYLEQWSTETFRAIKLAMSDIANWENYVKKIVPAPKGTGKSAYDIIDVLLKNSPGYNSNKIERTLLI